MTDWTPRELELNLSFLKEGTFKMEVFKDGINADRFAEDYKLKTLEVNKNSKISVQMEAGGGWAAIISKQDIN
jgi:alpha-glucosidase